MYVLRIVDLMVMDLNVICISAPLGSSLSRDSLCQYVSPRIRIIHVYGWGFSFSYGAVLVLVSRFVAPITSYGLALLRYYYSVAHYGHA
jgi:hypothetical protein